MKKFLIIFSLIAYNFINIFSLRAAQIDGGEIHWFCLPGSGDYIFFMNLYRDCSEEAFAFTDQYLIVTGGNIDSILLKPDKPTYNRYDGGNISPKGLTGCKKECDNGVPDDGAKQFLPFYSDVISLSGVPPDSGLVFSWSNAYRDSNQVNLQMDSSSIYVLRAVMYPYKNKSLDTCYDSSPRFMDLHAPIVRIGAPYNLNHVAVDDNLDSIGISFDGILCQQSFSNPTYAAWKPGYSTKSPFPGPNQDPRNIAVSLDSLSGHMSGTIFSESSIGKDYAYSIRVDAYREGIKIASVWRDATFSTKVPDTLNTGQINEKPIFKINGVKSNNYHITAYVGDTLSIPIELLDSNTFLRDPNDSLTSKQYFGLRPDGFLFSNDFSDPNDCNVMGVEPCALLNPSPVRNTRTGLLEIGGKDSLEVYFNWILTCNAISYFEKSKLHSFNFLYMDEHCEPEISYASLSVDVRMRLPIIVRNANVLSISNANSLSGIKWYFNDSLLYKDSSSIAIAAPGSYYVRTNSSCHPVFFDVFTLGLDDNQWMNSLKVYPNPFDDKFTIELSESISKTAALSLRDLSGREIAIETFVQNNKIQINAVEKFPSGVYFLNISVGDKSSFRKIVKI